MREFSFITVTQLVREVKMEGLPRFSRTTFYRLVKKEKWPVPAKTGGGWRSFGLKNPQTEADKRAVSLSYYKALIKKHYNMVVEIPERPDGLMDFDEAVEEGLINDLK